MLFYIFMTPILTGLVIAVWRLHEMQKHDSVLYRFCQVRRETMALIREKNFQLTREDYIALRQMAEVTGATIHDYNSHKIYLFNLFKFLEAIRRHKKLEVAIHDGLEMKGEILALRNKFGDALMFAFLRFTPFSAVLLSGSKYVFTALAKLGINYFRTQARRVLEVDSWVETQKHTPTFG